MTITYRDAEPKDAEAVAGIFRTSFVDTFGHHPYPDTDAESPARPHPKSSSIGEGDLGKLTAALRDAFKGTAQPLPGSGGVAIWYLEDGFRQGLLDRQGAIDRALDEYLDGHLRPEWVRLPGAVGK